jgi:hypothetical protein
MTIESQFKENLRAPETLGMIMIKPNATETFLDVHIQSTMGGDVSPIFQNERCAQFIEDLSGICTIGTYYRDLSTLNYGVNIIDLFYGDKKDRRYFPMIQENYLGPVIFILFEYPGNYEELVDFMIRLKGNAQTHNEVGNIADHGIGIRGVLTKPHRYHSAEESIHLSDHEYREAFSPVVKNFIHTCDTPREIACALDLVLKGYDREDLERRGYDISTFIEQYKNRI